MPAAATPYNGRCAKPFTFWRFRVQSHPDYTASWQGALKCGHERLRLKTLIQLHGRGASVYTPVESTLSI